MSFGSVRYFGLVLFLILLSCAEDDISPNNKQILERIRYTDVQSLKFTTISGGQIYQAKIEEIENEEFKVDEVYQFNYAKDSLTIKNLSDPGPINRPFLQVKFEKEKPTLIKRYFPEYGVTLLHQFDYSEPGIVQINLDWIGSDGTFKNLQYGLYYINGEGNVSKVIKYRFDLNDQSRVYKYEDRSFQYDDKLSPWKGLYFPFFINRHLPDIKFFSKNNIVAADNAGEIESFQYEYSEDGKTMELMLETGQEVRFSYMNFDYWPWDKQ